MLKTLHHHIYAGKLQDLFSSSNIVLVYQALGSINVKQVKKQLEDGISKKQPKAAITAAAFHVKNTVVAGTKDEEFSRFFQASNLIIGWQLPSPDSSAQPDNAPAKEFTSDRSRSIVDLCGTFRLSQPTSRIAQPVIADLLHLSLELPNSQPLALLACFHKKERVTVGSMSQWRKLNEATVLHELLGTLEGVAGPLLNLESGAVDVVDVLESCSGQDLASTLDAAAAREPQQ